VSFGSARRFGVGAALSSSVQRCIKNVGNVALNLCQRKLGFSTFSVDKQYWYFFNTEIFGKGLPQGFDLNFVGFAVQTPDCCSYEVGGIATEAACTIMKLQSNQRFSYKICGSTYYSSWS
jgi:hypothetical protein